MALFEGMDLKKGITLFMVEFPEQEGRRPVYIRTMMTDKADEGMSIVQPIIEERKRKAKDILAGLPKITWYRKETEINKKIKDRWNNILNNPLFDFDQTEGLEVFGQVKDGLLAKGLVIETNEAKSNGEMKESSILFI